MISWLLQLLYGSTPAEFKSSVGLEESITRLRNATKRSVFSALTQEAAVGPVKESRVRLQHVIPMVGNSLKPFFFGHFELRGGQVYLSGRFSMLPVVKVFMTFWLGFALVFAAMALPGTLKGSSSGFLPLAGIGMFCLGVGFVWAAKRFSSSDVAWLSSVISTALGTPKSEGPQTAASTTNPVLAGQAGTPSVLRRIAGILALIGIANLVIAYIGPEALTPAHESAAVGYKSPAPIVVGAHGLFLLVLAVGAYRRKLFAWQLGFAYLAASWCVMVWQIFGNYGFAGLHESVWFKVISSVMALVVVVMWGLWWYGLKIHFEHVNAS
ncbi:MAG: hypothetical protein ACLQVL_34575 [Terriglobia bacterium]